MSDAAGRMSFVRVAVVPGPGQSGLLRQLRDDGSPDGDPVEVTDLVAAIRECEQNGGARWVWPATAGPYRALLRGGVRVARCHDVALVDGLILGRDAALGVSRDGARGARPADPDDPDAPGAPDVAANEARAVLAAYGVAAAAETARRADQEGLFDLEEAGPSRPDAHATLDALIQVHADQLRRIASDDHPDRFGLLVTAESAGTLVAAEMSLAGLPWRPEVHDALLTELLGPRAPVPGPLPAP